MSIRRRLHREQNGQTATEFALVLPVFCLLLFGVIQFGILFKDYVTLTDAARAGARTAAVSRLEDPADREEIVKAAVRRSASGLDQSCTPTTGLCISVAATAWEHGADVTVEAKYPYKIKLLGFVAAEGFLSSATTERVE